jgi:hypothetical protein
MPKPGSFWNWLQYIPIALEVGRMIRPPKPPEQPCGVNAGDIADLRKAVSERLEQVEQENARLQARVRDLESSFTAFQLLFYIGGAFIVVLVIIIMIAVLYHSAH